MRAILLLSFLFLLVQPSIGKELEIGKAAPAIDATLLSGKRFTSSNYAGKVLIVNIWATWCPPCREEMPELDAFYKKYRGQGLVLIAISLDTPEDLPKVRAAMRRYSFPAALTSHTHMPGYGAIKRIPLTYVVDRQGVLRHDGSVGTASVDLAFLERTVAPLLRAPPRSPER